MIDACTGRMAGRPCIGVRETNQTEVEGSGPRAAGPVWPWGWGTLVEPARVGNEGIGAARTGARTMIQEGKRRLKVTVSGEAYELMRVLEGIELQERGGGNRARGRVMERALDALAAQERRAGRAGASRRLKQLDEVRL